MKIVLEEKDINEILTQHVKTQNILGLADKDFSIELEIDGDTVSANLDTDVASLVNGETPKKATPKKRRTKASTKVEEPEVEDKAPVKDSVPLSKQAVVEPTQDDSSDDEPEEEEVKEEKPPFRTEEEDEVVVKADSKPRKSLFA